MTAAPLTEAPPVAGLIATDVCTAPVRVVFADDSGSTRTLLRHILSAAADVTIVGEAADSSQALALVDTEDPDCVVLDIQMPGVGGFESLAELLRRRPGTPVIMLSGFSSPSVIDRALASGAAAFLDKTTQLKQLPETILRVMNAARSDASAASSAPTTDRVTTAHAPSAPAPRTDVELRRIEYAVSHDFAAPLRSMRGFATLLEEKYGKTFDATASLFLAQILAAATRMQAMIDDLLVYSRAGRREPRADRIALNEVAAETVRSLATAISERNAEVTVGDLPVVIGDADMVHAALRHLILNGLTFNMSKIPHVRVEAAAEPGMAAITVTDNGMGIAASLHEPMFDLFRQLNGSDAFPGTGSGLALCRRLLAMQGGSVHVHASSPEGTTLRILLPYPVNNHGDVS